MDIYATQAFVDDPNNFNKAFLLRNEMDLSSHIILIIFEDSAMYIKPGSKFKLYKSKMVLNENYKVHADITESTLEIFQVFINSFFQSE